MPLAEPTVHIVDDDPRVRDSLCWLFESIGLAAVGYDSPQGFLGAYEASGPGCLIADVRMPGMSGLQLLEELAAREIDLPVIMLTGYPDVDTAVRAMKGGAVEFLRKPYEKQIMLDTVQRCIAEHADRIRTRARQERIERRLSTLSPRERDVMQGIVDGLSSKEIGRRLGISPRTVDVHRRRIKAKMKAPTAVSLVTMLATLGRVGRSR